MVFVTFFTQLTASIIGRMIIVRPSGRLMVDMVKQREAADCMWQEGRDVLDHTCRSGDRKEDTYE